MPGFHRVQIFVLRRSTILLPSGIIPSFVGGRAVQRNNCRIRRRLKCLFLVRLFVFLRRTPCGCSGARNIICSFCLLAGAAAVLKPGLSAYTPVIGGDVHEALEGLFVRGGVSAADGGEDGRPGGSRGCA